MPAETGLTALLLKNITWIVAAVVGIVSTTAIAIHRLAGLERKHKALEDAVLDSFKKLFEEQRAIDLKNAGELRRITDKAHESSLQAERRMVDFHHQAMMELKNTKG
mgnify:CR=1 FL=1